MGVPFHNRTVLKCARVALIAIADHILFFPGRFIAGLPFPSRGEACAAKPAKSGVLYLINNLLSRHLGEGVLERLITADGKIILNFLRINGSAISQYQALLFIVKRNIAVMRQCLVGSRV